MDLKCKDGECDNVYQMVGGEGLLDKLLLCGSVVLVENGMCLLKEI